MLLNLLGKTLIENSIGALKHHIKKKEVVRNLEIDAAKEIQIEKIHCPSSSKWKGHDEKIIYKKFVF